MKKIDKHTCFFHLYPVLSNDPRIPPMKSENMEVVTKYASCVILK